MKTSHATVHAALFATAPGWGLNVSAVKALTEHVDLSMLASIVAFAAGGATVQRLWRCASPLEITWLVHAVGASMLAVHTIAAVPDRWQVIASLSTWHCSLTLYSGVPATAAGAVAWSHGIAAIGVGRTATYLSWVPLFGVAFGALLLGEPLNRWHAIGLAAVLIGSVMATRTSSATAAGLRTA